VGIAVVASDMRVGRYLSPASWGCASSRLTTHYTTKAAAEAGPLAALPRSFAATLRYRKAYDAGSCGPKHVALCARSREALSVGASLTNALRHAGGGHWLSAGATTAARRGGSLAAIDSRR